MQHTVNTTRGSISKIQQHVILILLLCVITFMAISCATVPKETQPSTIFDNFEKKPDLIAKSDSAFLRDFAASLDDATLEALTALSTQQDQPSMQQRKQHRSLSIVQNSMRLWQRRRKLALVFRSMIQARLD